MPKNFNAKVMLGPPTSIFLSCAFSPPCSFLEAPFRGKRQPLDLFWTLRFYLINFTLSVLFIFVGNYVFEVINVTLEEPTSGLALHDARPLSRRLL